LAKILACLDLGIDSILDFDFFVFLLLEVPNII
jgi:hypothetical protein